jgi:hypothetical protein
MNRIRRSIRSLLAMAALLSTVLFSTPLLANEVSTAPNSVSDVSSQHTGSFEVAPVRILGVPALVVASPELPGSGSVVSAQRRAEVIEGNLNLLYANQSLCTQAEQLSETILERLVLGGPREQQLCSGDPWAVHGSADQLVVERVAGPAGSVLLQARLPGRCSR